MKPKLFGKITKRDIIELSVIVVIFLTIYLTGSQAEVFGRVQSVILQTGIMNAKEQAPIDSLAASYHFTLRDLEGNEIKGNELKGKTIFINQWATWCPPCVAEMPGINKLYKKLSDREDIVFLMISEDRSLEKATNWSAKRGFDFPIYQTNRTPEVFQSNALPTTFVVSPEGRIIYKHVGMANYNSKRFKKFLEESSSTANAD